MRPRDGAGATDGSFWFIERRPAQAVQLEQFWGHFQKLLYIFFIWDFTEKGQKVL